ncbi:hypothetical protein BHE90_016793 [Fusarium euwallaceae]|uniref:Uncharacterized protein n=1 Tax=Fusarium euwallaceae TaxID=1147111 RepID=A0A430KZD8_9HYPO|nr:hypothetical protein BHE90_016793 [Fusarium euwallaceae]
MPNLWSCSVKSVCPFLSQILREPPTKVIVPKPHPDQMSPFLWCFAVDKSFASMQDGEVIDKVYVTGLGADLEACRPSNAVYSIKGFDLTQAKAW